MGNSGFSGIRCAKFVATKQSLTRPCRQQLRVLPNSLFGAPCAMLTVMNLAAHASPIPALHASPARARRRLRESNTRPAGGRLPTWSIAFAGPSVEVVNVLNRQTTEDFVYLFRQELPHCGSVVRAGPMDAIPMRSSAGTHRPAFADGCASASSRSKPGPGFDSRRRSA